MNNINKYNSRYRHGGILYNPDLKYYALLLLVAIICIAMLVGCKKYPDNTGIHLRSKKERIANTWKVENYKINGADFTSLVANYTETFTKSGNYSYTWGKLNGSGSWSFQDNRKEINLLGNDKHSSRTLVILKLEEKTFWYYYMDGDDRYELHLIEK